MCQVLDLVAHRRVERGAPGPDREGGRQHDAIGPGHAVGEGVALAARAEDDPRRGHAGLSRQLRHPAHGGREPLPRHLEPAAALHPRRHQSGDDGRAEHDERDRPEGVPAPRPLDRVRDTPPGPRPRSPPPPQGSGRRPCRGTRGWHPPRCRPGRRCRTAGRRIRRCRGGPARTRRDAACWTTGRRRAPPAHGLPRSGRRWRRSRRHRQSPDERVGEERGPG